MAKIKFNSNNDDAHDKAMQLQLSEAQWAELEELLENRNKIGAIKLVKEWQNCSLTQAKTLVEAHHESLCKLDPKRFGKTASPGCSVSVGVVFLAVTLGGMWTMWG